MASKEPSKSWQARIGDTGEADKLADRSRNVVMPAFTHLQRAQPIIAGAEALAWNETFDRDQDRLGMGKCGGLSGMFEECRNDSPLGSGAIAGTSLPIDAHYTAFN